MTHGAPWDLVVLGGGTAGLVAAYTGATLGARVALVERERTGGDCLWTGCVPSKALIAAANRAADARGAHALGVDVAGVRVDFPRVMDHVRSAIRAIEPVDSPDALREAGVEVLTGHARFSGPRSVVVGHRQWSFQHALVATGAAPRLPAIPGLDRALTTETVWSLEALPDRLVVLGGGAAGCELGQAFARLGSHVTIVEIGDRLLRREDPDAAQVVRSALEADGVQVLTGHRVTEVRSGPGLAGDMTVRGPDGLRSIAFDALLVAVGRTPRTTDLGLGTAGVAVRHGAVQVDRHLRTTNPGVWAAGDVTGMPQLTHLAGYHGGLAATHALLGIRRRVDLRVIPRVTFTDPEVASVGAPTWPAAPGYTPRVVTRPHTHVDRAITEQHTAGFARLAVDASGSRVAGATIVGRRAGEALAEMTVAVRKRTRVTELADTVHAYPTYADGQWNAALDHVRERLASPGIRRVAQSVVAARRALAR